MNNIEKRMYELLKELRDEYGVVEIKSEFEAEGSRTDELVKLNEIVFRANMDIVIKIGGCEAVSDMDKCRVLGAKGVMAPMIETAFAMQKFIGAVQKVFSEEEREGMHFVFNAETITGFNNLDDILNVKDIGLIDCIVVGRHDLSASMGLPLSEINGEAMFEKTWTILEKAKKKNIIASFGGSLLPAAVPFIKRMGPVLDRFETRKVVFTYDENLNFEKAFMRALEFELLFLKNKRNLYSRMAGEDASRIDKMETQLVDLLSKIK